MNTTTEKVMAEALSLSPHARAFVAERLIESLEVMYEEALSPAWRDELQRRCKEMDEGTVGMREAADVFTKAYATLT